MMKIPDKLPNVGTTIFTRMSQLAATHDAVNLSQGFPDYPCDPDLLRRLGDAALAGQNQYAPMAGLPTLRQAIAAKMLAHQGVTVDPESEITITAGGTQALFTAIAALLCQGDEAILLDPAYDSYEPAVATQGARAVRIPLWAPDFQVDWDRVRAAVTTATRMIVVNTPNNPTGRRLTATDLDCLAALATRHDLLVLSDEVYEHLIFDGARHLGVLGHPGLRQRSLAVYSFGKTFHATGWKVGYCVAAPALSQVFRKVHQFLVFSVNTPAQHALADHLSNPAHWQGLADFLAPRRARLAAGLAAAGFRLLPCEGTYFQLADYRQLRPDLTEEDFACWLTSAVGVACIPVSAFYADGCNQHLARFCFAKQPATLDLAISRLRAL